MRIMNTKALYITTAATLMIPGQYADASGMALEEVIVTAQHREESLQDVPISVSTLGAEQLKMRGIDTLADIGADIPNVTVNSFNTSPSTVRLFIRGIGQNDSQITQDPSVALYLDGVYIGTSFGAGFDGVDMQRIEVLRGPQGTLYGRNATGGAVNIITNRADTSGMQFKQDFTVGNDGMFKSKTVFNTPVTESTAFKLSYFHNELDGTIENDGPGEDFGMKDNDSLVLDGRIEPMDSLTVDLRYEYARLSNSQNYEQVTLLNDTGVIAGIVQHNEVDSNRLNSVTSVRPVLDSGLDIDAASMHADWAVSDKLFLRSITAWREMDNDFYHETFATSVMLTNGGSPILSATQVEYEQFSQEFQVLGDLDRLSYTAGIYYYSDESSQGADGSILLGNLQPINYAEAENESWAVYGEATYTPDLMDSRWHFTLGARYSEDDREASRNNEVDNVFGDYDNDFDNFNPSVTVAFDAMDSVSVYGKVTTGYKSGGTSQRSANQTLFSQGFEEEDITNYELGFKGDLLDRRLRLNAAVFYMEIDGRQSSVQTGSTPGQRDFLPIDGTEISGAELDMLILLSEGLTLSLGYGYLDTKLGEDSITVPPEREYFLTDELAYAPENSFTASLDYQRPLANGVFGFNINYAYQDEAITSINVADNTTLDDYDLLGAAVSWTEIEMFSLSGTFSLLMWGRNLADEEYGTISTSAFEPFGSEEIVTFGAPRSYGVTVSYDYL